MNDYMQALHQRFCREPTHPELERALDDTYHAPGEHRLAGPGAAAPCAGSGDRAAGGDVPGILHRRVSTGHGDRQGDRAIFLRGRGREASHREGESVASPVQKLIRYTKKKGCQRQLFLNFLITVVVSPGYFFLLWYVVSLQRRRMPWQRNAPTAKATSEREKTVDGRAGIPPGMIRRPARPSTRTS